MSTETTTTIEGGFLGDPAEAFTPLAMGGCCGSSPTAAAEPEAAKSGQCCGTIAEAAASGGCCGEAPSMQAVASGTGCCG